MTTEARKGRCSFNSVEGGGEGEVRIKSYLNVWQENQLVLDDWRTNFISSAQSRVEHVLKCYYRPSHLL